jgi:hypothetical protein
MNTFHLTGHRKQNKRDNGDHGDNGEDLGTGDVSAVIKKNTTEMVRTFGMFV